MTKKITPIDNTRSKIFNKISYMRCATPFINGKTWYSD